MRPPVTVIPDTVTLSTRVIRLMSKTRTVLLPLTVKSDAPGPAIVKSSVMSSSEARVMACGVLKRELKVIVSAVLGTPFAWMIASRSDPAPESLVFVTVNTAGTSRVSSDCNKGRERKYDAERARGARRRPAGAPINKRRSKRDIDDSDGDKGGVK
jgi:hypothetical protein